jgi:hypothetical protein
MDLTITLAAEEWNVVLDVLADGRHRIVAPLLQKIIEQAQRAQQQPQTPNVVPMENSDARNLR